MQPPNRCPRCGYPLRYGRGSYRCDSCGFPNSKPPLLDSIRSLERNIKSRVQGFLDKDRGAQYQRMIVQYPYAARQSICSSCGLRLPYGLKICPYCRAVQPTSQIAQPLQPPTFTVDSADQRVLDYIVARNGTISMSQAARDLSISPDALQSIINRLKSSGFLRPS